LALEGQVVEQIQTLNSWIAQSIYPLLQGIYEEQQNSRSYFDTMTEYLEQIANKGVGGGGDSRTGGLKGLFGGGGGKAAGGNTAGQSKIAQVGQGVSNLVNALSNLTSATKGLMAFKAAPTNKFINFVRSLRSAFGLEQGVNATQTSSVIQAMGHALGNISGGMSRLARGLLLYAIPSKLGVDHAFVNFIQRLFSPNFLNQISYNKAREFNNAISQMSRGLSRFAKTLAISVIPIVGAALFMEASGISPSTIISLGVITGILAWSLSHAAKNVQGIDGDDSRKVSEVIQWGALGLVAIGLAFLLLPDSLPSPPSKEWSLNTGIAIAAFTIPFVYIANRIRDVSLSTIAYASIAIGSIALGLAGAAYIFTFLPGEYKSPPYEWSLKSGLALLAFTLPFTMIALATQSAGWSAIAIASAAIITLATSLLAVTQIFQYLPDDYKSPPAQWSLKSGLALLAFSLPLISIAALSGGGISSIFKGSIGAVFAAGGILAVAHIFQYLPDTSDLKTIPLEWAAKTSLGLVMFGATVAAVGFLVQSVGYAGFLAGAVALPIAAGAIIATAYVFKLAPDGMFEKGGFLEKVSDAVSYFAKQMLTIFTKLAKEFLPIANQFLTGIIPVVGDFISKVAGPLGEFAVKIGAAAQKILSSINELLKPVLDTFVETLKVGKNLIVGVVSEIANAISSIGKTFVNSIGEMKKFIVDVTQLGSEKIAQVGASLLSMAGGVAAMGAALAGAKVAQAGGQLAKGLSDVASAAADSVAGWFGADKGNDEDPQTAFGVIKSLANKSAGIQQAADSIKSLVNSINLMSKMKDIDTGKIGTLITDIIDKVSNNIGKGDQRTLDRAIVTPIGTLASYDKPIQRIAKNINTIASSMTDVLKQINNIPESKFSTFSDLMYNTNSFAQKSEDIGEKLKNVKEFIVKLDDTSLENVSEKMDELVSKMGEAMSGGSSDTGNLESRVSSVESQQSQMIQMLQQINQNLSKISRQLNEPLTVENV